jgi:hypothetical protein
MRQNNFYLRRIIGLADVAEVAKTSDAHALIPAELLASSATSSLPATPAKFVEGGMVGPAPERKVNPSSEITFWGRFR